MAVFLERSCVLHLPKTGGCWVEKALRNAFGKRATPSKIRHLSLQHIPKNTFRITFVRHPLAWYKSYWTYKVNYGWDVNNSFDMKIRTNVFQDFIDGVIEHCPGHFTETVNIFAGTRDNQIEFVGRQENLVNDLITSLHLAGEYNWFEDDIRNTPRQNQSLNKVKEFAIYRPDQEIKILDLEKEVIERFYKE